MKTLLLMIVAAMSLNVSAQENPCEHQKNSHQNKSIFKDLSPKEAAELKTKRMTLHLDLNEKQQKEIQNLILKEETFKQEKRKEHEALKSEDERPTKEEQLSRMNEKLDRKIEMKSKMKSILDAEQYDKWERMMHKKEKRNKKRKRKGHRPGEQ